jgi:hypothetical protein
LGVPQEVRSRAVTLTKINAANRMLFFIFLSPFGFLNRLSSWKQQCLRACVRILDVPYLLCYCPAWNLATEGARGMIPQEICLGKL